MSSVVSRTTVAAVGLVGSLALSVVLYVLTDSVFVFLLVPFVPILLGRDTEPAPRRCPICGFETTDDAYAYCPRDGTELD